MSNRDQMVKLSSEHLRELQIQLDTKEIEMRNNQRRLDDSNQKFQESLVLLRELDAVLKQVRKEKNEL